MAYCSCVSCARGPLDVRNAHLISYHQPMYVMLLKKRELSAVKSDASEAERGEINGDVRRTSRGPRAQDTQLQ